MTREEEIIETAKFIYSPSSGIPQSLPMRVGFIEGAKWADEHPKDGLVSIDKVCGWLKNNTWVLYKKNEYEIEIKNLLNDFRKAMEE